MIDSNVDEKAGQSSDKNVVAEVAATFEWLIIAFILAFTFRAFVMEAFRIPTGSMAETLMGAHFRLRCTQCGCQYNFGFVPERYGLNRNDMPQSIELQSTATRCPICGYDQILKGNIPVSYGDRILVLKHIFNFGKPKRWDVVVFRNPQNPLENYIKRLVGQSGETVEIIDGDIYINGKISQKPPKAQNELWMPVYNSNFRPAKPAETSFNGRCWQQPFESNDSMWQISRNNPAEFVLDCDSNQMHMLSYNTSVGGDCKVRYAYNDPREYIPLPYCSDLMVRFCVSAKTKSLAGALLSKYGINYKAWISPQGQMLIVKDSNQSETILAQKQISLENSDKPILFEFANVDHMLIVRFGNEKLKYNLGSLPDDAGTRITTIEPQIKIFGAGKLAISHVEIFRDIYYTSTGGPQQGRATEGHPFTLGEDEYFVLGDNSPESEDCRWWKQKGLGNNNKLYTAGIVPADYLVGKALLVYWPSGYKPFEKFPFPIIPNISKIRLIYGGSDRKL